MTLEASSNNVPSIKIVTELLQEEQKLKEKGVGGVGKTLSILPRETLRRGKEHVTTVRSQIITRESAKNWPKLS